MKRGFFFKKFMMILLFGTAAVLLFSFIVMSLWNGILPSVIHVSAITFPQAIGILVLSKILFSGFKGGPRRGGPWGGGPAWKQGMHDKWQKMTPEERETFKQKMRERCGSWRRGWEEQQPTSTISSAAGGGTE
jgi:hypothetical protein